MENIVIIGAGPAGISAALYAARGNMNPLVINNGIGALEKAEKIENYYGLEQPLSGKELYERGISQAEALGVHILDAEVLGISGFDTFTVKTTAVCDAFFYRGKEVAVVGNGEFALHEAEELRNVTQDVTIYTDGKEPEFSREHPIAVNTMKIQAIEGDDKVSGLLMQSDTAAQDAEAPENSFYPVDGVFVALGTAGSTEIARQMGAEITDKGNIKTDEEMATTIPGLFAAGDCTGGLLQVSKAVYEGSMAAISAGKYVRHKKVS